MYKPSARITVETVESQNVHVEDLPAEVRTLPPQDVTGWQESRGVQAEIRIAAELGKPVRYLEPDRQIMGETLLSS